MASGTVVDVAVVGGGPAGAAVAARVARTGRSVVVLERAPAWRWRASGGFPSPAAVDALRRTGLDEAAVRRVARPIPAMVVTSASATSFALTYGADAGGEPAVGFDRSALDPALLDLASRAGAVVRRGASVSQVRFPADPRDPAVVSLQDDHGRTELRARVVVGADGPRSVVARALDVHRPIRLAPRVGLSYHVADPRPDTALVSARMQVLRDGYVGLAPVPGGRINVGIVLGPTWARRLAET